MEGKLWYFETAVHSMPNIYCTTVVRIESLTEEMERICKGSAKLQILN